MRFNPSYGARAWKHWPGEGDGSNPAVVCMLHSSASTCDLHLAAADVWGLDQGWMLKGNLYPPQARALTLAP